LYLLLTDSSTPQNFNSLSLARYRSNTAAIDSEACSRQELVFEIHQRVLLSTDLLRICPDDFEFLIHVVTLLGNGFGNGLFEKVFGLIVNILERVKKIVSLLGILGIAMI